MGSCFLYTLWHLESVGNHSTHNPPSRLWDSASFHMTSLASHTDTRGTMLFCFKTSVVLCSESFGGLLHLNPRVAFGLYAQVFSSHSALQGIFSIQEFGVKNTQSTSLQGGRRGNRVALKLPWPKGCGAHRKNRSRAYRVCL